MTLLVDIVAYVLFVLFAIGAVAVLFGWCVLAAGEAQRTLGRGDRRRRDGRSVRR